MIPVARLAAATLLAGLSCCSAALAGDIRVTDPYARAVPPGQPNSAVFMSLRNSSRDARALVAAESGAANTVELHTHVKEGGMMRMRKIERIDLPAGETVTLQPGGLHVMLIGLTQALEPDASVDVTLIYDDGSKDRIKAPVRALTPSPMPHH